MPEPRTPQSLRDSAQAYRLEASALELVLPRLRAWEGDETRARITRFRDLASDLERAAQRMEAIAQ